MIKKIERFSLTSAKPFDEVVAALKAGIGHPDMAELKSAIEKGLSKAGLLIGHPLRIGQ